MAPRYKCFQLACIVTSLYLLFLLAYFTKSELTRSQSLGYFAITICSTLVALLFLWIMIVNLQGHLPFMVQIPVLVWTHLIQLNNVIVQESVQSIQMSFSWLELFVICCYQLLLIILSAIYIHPCLASWGSLTLLGKTAVVLDLGFIVVTLVPYYILYAVRPCLRTERQEVGN